MGQLAFLGHMSAVAEHGSLMLASLPKGADEGPFSSRITLRLRGGSTYRTPQADLSCAINSTGLKSKGDPTGVAENDKTAGLDSAGAGSWQGAVETAPPNLGAVPETQARRLLSQRMEAPTHGVTPTVPIGGARNLMRVSSRYEYVYVCASVDVLLPVQARTSFVCVRVRVHVLLLLRVRVRMSMCECRRA